MDSHQPCPIGVELRGEVFGGIVVYAGAEWGPALDRKWRARRRPAAPEVAVDEAMATLASNRGTVIKKVLGIAGGFLAGGVLIKAGTGWGRPIYREWRDRNC